MKSTFENNILTIYPEGTLDTNNAILMVSWFWIWMI